jgi:hypothetical protein
MRIHLDWLSERAAKTYIAICDKFLIRSSDKIPVLNLTEAEFLRFAPEVRARIIALEEQYELEASGAKAAQEEAAAFKQAKIAADAKAGLERLKQHVEEGLEGTPENGARIRKFLDEHDQIKGLTTPQTVDIAISCLGPRGTNVLTWKPKVAPAPPPPPPPPVRHLDNGEPELPLEATEKEMRAASVTQLKDLSKRRNEGKKNWRKDTTGHNI